MARPGNKTIHAKLVLLGGTGTGKTSLVLRFVKGQFFDHKEPTIGAAFFTQILSLPEATVKLDIWDTAGQERYHSLAPMYYRGAAAAIVVYDISSVYATPTSPVLESPVLIVWVVDETGLPDPEFCYVPPTLKDVMYETLVRAKKLVQELKRQGNPNLVMALVANKSDLEASREVQTEEGEQFSQENGMFFIETSAKSAHNINEIFHEIAKRLAKVDPPLSTGMNLRNDTQKRRICCLG